MESSKVFFFVAHMSCLQSDITTSLFSRSGRFTEPQRIVYEANRRASRLGWGRGSTMKSGKSTYGCPGTEVRSNGQLASMGYLDLPIKMRVYLG